MVGAMALERVEVHVRQIVAGRHRFLFHDVGDGLARIGGFGKFEVVLALDVVAEGDDVDALTVLRHPEILGVENLVVHRVAELLKRFDDHLEGLAFLVVGQPFDVFAENDARLVFVADLSHVEKEGAAASALIVVLKTHALAGHREGLARKARQADVEVRDRRLGLVGGDVAVNFFGRGEVGRIGLLGRDVPFGHENRFNLLAECPIKAHADPSDPGKKIDGSVRSRLDRRHKVQVVKKVWLVHVFFHRSFDGYGGASAPHRA